MKKLHKNTNTTASNIRAFSACMFTCWCYTGNGCSGGDNVDYGVYINSRVFPQDTVGQS